MVLGGEQGMVCRTSSSMYMTRSAAMSAMPWQYPMSTLKMLYAFRMLDNAFCLRRCGKKKQKKKGNRHA
jgi:hypothetical protein